MRYLLFGPERQHYPVCLLTKTLRSRDLGPFVQGIETDVVAYNLPNDKKLSKAAKQLYCDQLFPVLCQLKVDYLIVTDGDFFKFLTKVPRVDRVLGYVLPCTLKGYEHFSVMYAPSPNQVIYDPKLLVKVTAMLDSLQAHRNKTYVPPGSSIIHHEVYPTTVEDIKAWLDKLIDIPLAIDIETFSLRHPTAGIGTITMCWNQHDGIAFPVDLGTTKQESLAIRALLRDWFCRRRVRTIYHGASFDVYILVYQLFMVDLLDTNGLLEGLEILLRNVEDTLLLTYLATNSCSGNKLSLKDQAQEFAGNYAVDVTDITAHPREDVLRYNLIDGLSTWYLWNKYRQRVIDDQQEGIYQTLFKPALADIIQMQLTGLPLDMDEVARGKAIMQKDQDDALAQLSVSPFVRELERLLNEEWVVERNTLLKIKRVTLADAKETFNPASPAQVSRLLYEIAGLPVLGFSDSGQPSTKSDFLKALRNHTQDPDALHLLEHLLNYKAVAKILTSFIPAFEAATLAHDGWHYLYGNFNICGTVSGRLSSSDPNLQNIPASGSKYAKIIKQMFRAPPGKLFTGLDFNSLEDRISALTTKDPNKLKVYTDGYDGHCLRAFSYFGDQMSGIVETPQSINSIADLYPKLRQDSKAPTFALTYQGTFRTLMTNCGFDDVTARSIEARYHELYVVSDQWVADRLKQAAQCGYITVAFGLRLRTPMMHQTVMGTRSTPYEAEAEGRTAGNALGQSWGLLNTRAGTEFLQRVRQSRYRDKIRPCAQIHDAQYFIVDDDVEALTWMNKWLVKAVQWQDDPEIAHPDVKLGGTLSVFFPTWAHECPIPNHVTVPQLQAIVQEYLKQ